VLHPDVVACQLFIDHRAMKFRNAKGIAQAFLKYWVRTMPIPLTGLSVWPTTKYWFALRAG
jgi:hypothetical protein